MINVYKLTEAQKNALVGQLYDGVQLFNPFQNIENEWCISAEEVNECTNEDCMFVKDLEMIPFIGKSIITDETVIFDKQNGLALNSISFYNDKLILFRVNETRLELNVSELSNTGATHLSNVLGILNKANYTVIHFERGKGWFKTIYPDLQEDINNVSSFTQQQQVLLGQASMYFISLLNP